MTASLFLNQSGSFDFTQANQVMRFSGYGRSSHHRLGETTASAGAAQSRCDAIRGDIGCTQLLFGSGRRPAGLQSTANGLVGTQLTMFGAVSEDVSI